MTFGESPEINMATTRLGTRLEPNQVLTVESYFGEQGNSLGWVSKKTDKFGETSPEPQ